MRGTLATRGERDDPDGAPYMVVYDTYKHPMRYLDELNRETDATFDSRGRVTSTTYPELDQEVMGYDDRNNETSYTRKAKPGSGLADLTVTAIYDPTWNKPTSITNARGVTTTFSYYASGNGTSLMQNAVHPADGYGNGTATYGFTYTAIGKPLTATDPDGVATTNAYDTSANLTSTTLDPGTGHVNSTTVFTYDTVGNTVSATDPRGFATTTIYDLDRRKLEDDRHHGAAGTNLVAASQSVYDALGRVTDTRAGTAFSGTTVATWLTTAHTTYTPTSKPATVTDADSRTVTTAYDDLDRVSTVTDPVGRAVHNAYDAAGQLLTEYRGWGDRLQQAYATHAYGLNGEQLSVYDADGAAHLTSYTYDGFDRLLSTIYADGSHEDATYDANGNVLTRTTRAGPSLAYAYDTLDRLRVKTVPTWGAASGHVVSTSFSPAGRITGESDSAGPGLSYSFDTAGRATAELQLTGGTSRTVTWTLDAMGNHTRLTWPDAYAVNYTFDALNRMSIVSVNGGAVLAAYTYDPLSRRTAVSYNGGTSAMDYTYSNAGDLLTLTDDFAGTANDVTFTDTYTNAHQLQSEAISNSAYIWTPATPTGHDSYGTVNNLNQYPTLNSGALTWDANGNLATITGATYTHDAENRMVAVSGTATATYTYDPLNRRVAKTLTSASTAFLHDGSNEISEYDNSGALVRRFVPGAGIDEPVAMVTAAGATTFFHTDRKGSVIAMADTTGAPVEGPYTYDAYGNCFVGVTTTSCTTLAATTEPFRYTGQRYDAETGNYYYRARYYCVGIGRFCETDPAGYKPDVNWYSAFGNDPTDKSDPTGEIAQPMTACFDIGDCFGISNKAGQEKNSQNAQAPTRVAQAEGTPVDPDAEGDVGASARQFEENQQRALEREREERDQRERERDAEAARRGGGGTGSPPGVGKEIDLPRISLTRTVESKLSSRPFLNSPLTAGQIMSTGTGRTDPGGLPNAVRYDARGTFGTSTGTYELVIDPTTGLIYHFSFTGD